MSEKVLLTKEQVGAIDLWLSRFDDKEALVNSHSKIIEDNGTDLGWNWDEEFRSLNGLSVARLAKALFVGYEIEEPKPQFEPGDLVMYEGRFITLDKWHPQHEAWTYNGAGWFAAERNLKKPTQDEIFWLHDLKRDCVNDFKDGDVVYHLDGNLLVVSENFGIAEEDDCACTVADAIRWSEEGIIKYIYPVDSRKPYRKEEN